MNNIFFYRKNENGSVLILAVVVMLVLSIVVIMGSNNSIFELKLAGNERCISTMKANAESAALAGLEQFKALGDNSDILKNTSWDSSTRLSWYHRGEDNCITNPTGLRGGDINNDGTVDKHDGKDAFSRAKIFSQAFLGRNSDADNWGPGSCAELLDSSGKKIPSMENAKFMVLDTGPPTTRIADSLGLKTNGNRKWHKLLITGVDERCGGKYMVQIAYLARF